MNRRICLFLCLAPAAVNAQKEIIPPSPNAANMAEYISLPMSLYTGNPKISIPICTVTDGDITLPISLDYGGGGIKVSEMASSCGLGWNLNAGGLVTRSIMGWPDETPVNGYWYSIYKSSFPQYDESDRYAMGAGTVDGQPDMFFYSFPSGSGRFTFDKSKKAVSMPLKNHIIKYDQPILFTSNMSGPATFIPGWTVTDEMGYKYVFRFYEKGDMVPFMVVDGIEGNGPMTRQALNTWYLTEIQSPKGNKVQLEYDDLLVSYDLPPSRTENCQRTNGASLPAVIKEKQRLIIHTKKLRRIIHRGGTVEFVYSSQSRPDLIGDKALERIVIRNISSTVVRQFVFEYKCLYGNLLKNVSDFPISGENNFYANAFNFTPSDPMKRRLVLTSLTEMDAAGTASVGRHGFEYIHDIGLPDRCSENVDFWGYANGGTTPPKFLAKVIPSPPDAPFLGFFLEGKETNFTHAKQGTLNKITYPGGGSTTIEYESNSLTQVPPNMPPIVTRSSFGASITFSHALYGKPVYEAEHPFSWKTNSLGQPVKHYYVEFTIPEKNTYSIILQNMPYYPNAGIEGYLVNMANEAATIWRSNVNGTYNINLNAGIYRLYQAPALQLTTQTTNPDYMTTYSVGISGISAITLTYGPPPGETSRQVGGLRAKKVTTFDPVTNSSLVREYDYDVNGGSSGAITGVPMYTYEKRAGAPGEEDALYRVFSFNSIFPLSTTMGGQVGYSFVSERRRTTGGETLGRSDYSFIGPNQHPDIIFSPAIDYTGYFPTPDIVLPDPPVENRDWTRGHLLGRIDYNEAGVAVKRVVNEYGLFSDTTGIRAYKVVVYHERIPGPNLYYYIAYHPSTGHFFLKRSTETVFDGGTEVVRVQRYEHSRKSLLPVREITSTSSGDSSVVYKSYPREYAPGTLFVDSLVNRNMVAYPIETVQTREVGSTRTVLSGSITTYKTGGKGLVDQVLELETAAPVALASFRFSNRGTGVLPPSGTAGAYSPDTRYNLRLTYNEYDTRGNPLQYTPSDGVPVSYVWGYNNQYPVAEIRNATRSAVVAALGGSTAVNSFGNQAAPTETAVMDFLSPLRSAAALKQAQVTTYTYRLLYGISSQTDASGRTVWYDYDGFGRLWRTRDQFGNVIEDYKYNYRP